MIGVEWNTIKAISVAIYGLLYCIMGSWLLWRGAMERPLIRKPSWMSPTVPGRIVLGVFLLFATYREWDISLNRLRYTNPKELTDASNDGWSVAPVAIGCLFGIWAAVRFIRDDVGDQTMVQRQRFRPNWRRCMNLPSWLVFAIGILVILLILQAVGHGVDVH